MEKIVLKTFPPLQSGSTHSFSTALQKKIIDLEVHPSTWYPPDVQDFIVVSKSNHCDTQLMTMMQPHKCHN